MSRAISLLVKLLELFVTVAVAALVLVVLWGVLSRFVISVPSRWTEELATYLLSWLAMFGSALAFRQHQHLGVDVLTQHLHGDAQRLSMVIVQSAIALFAALVLVWGGTSLVVQTLVADQVTPALRLPMGLIYVSVPISGMCIVLFAGDELFRLIRWGASQAALSTAQGLPSENSATESLNVD